MGTTGRYVSNNRTLRPVFFMKRNPCNITFLFGKFTRVKVLIPRGGGGGGETLHMKWLGILVGNFELNP